MNNATPSTLAFNTRVLICLVIALIYWGRLFVENRALRVEVTRLETELGLMKIEDLKQAYFVEIEKPDVPPEIAMQLDKVWQFRCYLPPNYDLREFHGVGRITKEGVYYSGNYGGYRNRTEYHPEYVLVTISLRKKETCWEIYYSHGGDVQSLEWRPLRTDLSLDDLCVQKLVSYRMGMRSFAHDTILPLFKLYDAKTRIDEEINGKTQSTYDGISFSIFPKERESDFEQLVRGLTPHVFDISKLAVGVVDEGR